VVDDTGLLLDISTRRTDGEILDWLRRWTNGPCVVAFDAPVIVANPSGNRGCERLMARYFGRFHAYCHAANTANPSFAAGPRALRLAEALGLAVDPDSSAARRALEVYPHPALVALFDLPRVLQYKAKPGRDLEHLRSEMQRLVDGLESLADASPPLLLKDNPDWQHIRTTVRNATRKVDLKRVEDAIDGVVCAYIAAYATAQPDRVRVLGDGLTGYILTPVTPTIAAQIDQDTHPATTPTQSAATPAQAVPTTAHAAARRSSAVSKVSSSIPASASPSRPPC
jgi:predicted RNase H-like nuclease